MAEQDIRAVMEGLALARRRRRLGASCGPKSYPSSPINTKQKFPSPQERQRSLLQTQKAVAEQNAPHIAALRAIAGIVHDRTSALLFSSADASASSVGGGGVVAAAAATAGLDTALLNNRLLPVAQSNAMAALKVLSEDRAIDKWVGVVRRLQGDTDINASSGANLTSASLSSSSTASSSAAPASSSAAPALSSATPASSSTTSSANGPSSASSSSAAAKIAAVKAAAAARRAAAEAAAAAAARRKAALEMSRAVAMLSQTMGHDMRAEGLQPLPGPPRPSRFLRKRPRKEKEKKGEEGMTLGLGFGAIGAVEGLIEGLALGTSGAARSAGASDRGEAGVGAKGGAAAAAAALRREKWVRAVSSLALRRSRARALLRRSLGDRIPAELRAALGADRSKDGTPTTRGGRVRPAQRHRQRMGARARVRGIDRSRDPLVAGRDAVEKEVSVATEADADEGNEGGEEEEEESMAMVREEASLPALPLTSILDRVIDELCGALAVAAELEGERAAIEHGERIETVGKNEEKAGKEDGRPENPKEQRGEGSLSQESQQLRATARRLASQYAQLEEAYVHLSAAKAWIIAEPVSLTASSVWESAGLYSEYQRSVHPRSCTHHSRWDT